MDERSLRMSEESLELLGIKITGKPESIQLAHYYLTLGAFTQAWATLEYIFDLCVATIYHRAPGGKFCGRRQPMALTRKLDYFRDAHRKIDELKKLAKTAEHIATFIEKVGGVRHLIIHSVQVRAAATYVYQARRAVPHTNKYMEARGNIDYRQIAKLTLEIAKRLQPMTAYAQLLIDTFPNRQK
jgi:hypothetical protein